MYVEIQNIDALVQDSSNCSALAMELLQSCPKSYRLDLCFNFAVVDYNIDAITPTPSISCYNKNWDPICLHGLTMNLAWRSNCISYELCNEITYPFPKFIRSQTSTV